MELQPGDFSLRAKYQRNVVAAVVSTAVGRSASPKTMLAIAEGADIRLASRPAAARQRVEDNAFQLGYFER
jgi:hypothetical protein